MLKYTKIENLEETELNHMVVIHFFKSAFCSKDCYYYMSILDAIESLAIKDGCYCVKYENGNIGYIAEYSGKENGFEIVTKPEREVTEKIALELIQCETDYIDTPEEEILEEIKKTSTEDLINYILQWER